MVIFSTTSQIPLFYIYLSELAYNFSMLFNFKINLSTGWIFYVELTWPGFICDVLSMFDFFQQLIEVTPQVNHANLLLPVDLFFRSLGIRLVGISRKQKSLYNCEIFKYEISAISNSSSYYIYDKTLAYILFRSTTWDQ